MTHSGGASRGAHHIRPISVHLSKVDGNGDVTPGPLLPHRPVATIYQTDQMDPSPTEDLLARIDELLLADDEPEPDDFPWLDSARWTPDGARPAGLPGIDLTRYCLDEVGYHLPAV